MMCNGLKLKSGFEHIFWENQLVIIVSKYVKSMENKIKRVVFECRPPSPDVPPQSSLW